MTKLCEFCQTRPVSRPASTFCSRACRGASQRATPEQQEAKKLRNNLYSKEYMRLKRNDPTSAEEVKNQRRLSMRKWAKEHPDIKKARNLLYKQNNRVTINAEQRIRAIPYRELHREELNTKALQYHKDNPEVSRQAAATRRARKLKAPLNDFSAEQWAEVQAAFHYLCAYCDKSNLRLEMDHITPLVAGGSHTLHNIVPACRSCNARKHDGPIPCAVQPLLLTCAGAIRTGSKQLRPK